MTQQEFIERVKSADIKQAEGWFDTLIAKCTDLYARGYLQASAYRLCNNYSYEDEEFREAILEISEFNIWGKK